jgi:Holliday junction resolvasome RuvABC endonuclease subunit
LKPSHDALRAGEFEGWYWGCDVGLTRVTIGVLSATDSNYASRRTDGLATDLAGKLLELGHEARTLALAMADLYPPAAIAVEMPFGKFRLTEFGAAFGVTVLGVSDAISEVEWPAPIWTTPVPEWKSATVGKGNASKDDVGEWVREELNVDAPSHDVSDALAIAAFVRAKFAEALA